MLTNNEVLKYSDLLYSLNEKGEQLPDGFSVLYENGGTDGIPHFKLIKEKNELLIIWIRGTDFTDPNDILINILTKSVNFYVGRCHHGYFHAAISIINLIHKLISNSNIDKIICLGHSLGGAVASIITTILNLGDNDNIQNINDLSNKFRKGGIRGLVFATPPTFSPSISLRTEEFITNIVLPEDIVPKLGNLFDNLKKYQKILVNIAFKMIELKNKNNKCIKNIDKRIISYIKKYQTMNICSDRIPGKVLVLNAPNLTIKQDSNLREMDSLLEYKNMMKHKFTNYHQSIKKVVPSNDQIFSNIQTGMHGIRFLKEYDTDFINLYTNIARSLQ